MPVDPDPPVAGALDRVRGRPVGGGVGVTVTEGRVHRGWCGGQITSFEGETT